ncbi:Hypothetical predicted protein [Lecanosticta acicola]|uniref:Uncharacterized protein n=1 Tax=Lecanosticta acicola TaxID=111012 RepID=A0AAI8Z8D9_9PEZI|nr:Hypothetical predicted protein [Lecanosticta acicola]
MVRNSKWQYSVEGGEPNKGCASKTAPLDPHTPSTIPRRPTINSRDKDRFQQAKSQVQAQAFGDNRRGDPDPNELREDRALNISADLDTAVEKLREVVKSKTKLHLSCGRGPSKALADCKEEARSRSMRADSAETRSGRSLGFSIGPDGCDIDVSIPNWLAGAVLLAIIFHYRDGAGSSLLARAVKTALSVYFMRALLPTWLLVCICASWLLWF